ncbi:MAG: rane protein [Alphaproteobacteria bacterium]|jgi:membrane protein|nr:rane protein [Alphaproteobacteria bacterium]
MNHSALGARLENMVSWFAASVLVSAAVVYALKLDLQQGKTVPALPDPTPKQEPLDLQLARAAEPGRGRKAAAPTHIPWRGWKDILARTYQEVLDDRILSLAAGVVFFCLAALFPAIAAGVSSYALFADAGTIGKHLSLLANMVPGSALDMVAEEITRIAAKSDGKLTFGFLLGFGIALWSANAGMKAIFDALNIIYDEDEKRGIIKLNLISLFFTFCAIGGALLAIGAVVVFPLVLAAFGLSSFDAPIIAFLRWPLMFVLVIVGLAVLYRYGPSRRRAQWRWLSVGSVFAAVTWLVVSSLFSWYLGNFANYNATYGSLGAVVGLMMWMWLSTIVVLVGAELNSEIEHQTARDTTVGRPKPLGTRGAVMADTVGAART